MTVRQAVLAPLMHEVPEEEGDPIVIPLSGWVDFMTEGRTHDAGRWEAELGDRAEFIVFATLDAAREFEAWRMNARAELAEAVLERRTQLNAASLSAASDAA